MQIKSTLELTMGLDKDKFRKIFAKVSGKKRLDNDVYTDHSLASEGITVAFRNSQYKKKVTLTIDPSGLLNGGDLPKFTRKLDAVITEYFKKKYTLEDFNTSKVVFATDMNVHSRENVSAYMKALQRIGKVKSFSPVNSREYNEDSYFWLKGNSNGIEFICYDLEEMLKAELEDADFKREQLKVAIIKAEGILRAEVQLVEAKSIRAYTDKIDTAKQIADLLKKDETVFIDAFTRIVPFGDFHKKGKAVEIIRSKIEDDKSRRRMIRLVELIPEKKSLHLAQKALKYRKIDDLMDTFAAFDLSPVTLSKRHAVKHLLNLYRYLE